jgi:hypothetical protein
LAWLLSLIFLTLRNQDLNGRGWLGLLQGLFSIVWTPLFLTDSLLNEPRRIRQVSPPAFKGALCLLLIAASLGALVSIFLISPTVTLFAWYLWAFTAEYLFVSKGHPSGLMLILAAFLITAPLAVLIAALAPRKQALLP